MKKQIIFSTLLFFSAMQGMDEPTKREKLWFPFPGKTVDDLWQMVRKDYETYTFFGEELPQETKQNIARFLLLLNNPRSFSAPQDQFFRKLLGYCFTFGVKQKEWKLPIYLSITHDGKYLVGYLRGTLNIYDAKTKECIKSIEKKESFWICKQGNLIGCREREGAIENTYNYSLYNIAKDQWHQLGQWGFWFTHCSQYVAGYDEKYLYLVNVADVDAIACYRIPCVDRSRSFVEFTCDDHILFGPGDGTVVLWTIGHEGLKELARYDSDGLLQSGRSRLVDYDGSEYLILGSIASLGIKIEKHDDGTVALEKAFYVPNYVCSVVGKEAVLVSEDEPFRLAIRSYSGKGIKNNEVMTTSAILSGEHIFYQTYQSRGRIPIMAYIARDNYGNGTHFELKEIKEIDALPYAYSFNDQNTLFAAPLAKDKETYGCLDFYGSMLTSISAKKVAFHPKGHVLLCECEDGTKKKYTMYPKGADEHFKRVANGALSMPQYFALQNVCNEIKKAKDDLLRVRVSELNSAVAELRIALQKVCNDVKKTEGDLLRTAVRELTSMVGELHNK